jgi:predicted transport protein
MSDIKLFRLTGDTASELGGKSARLEKHLQDHIEANMEALIGVRFLASEYSTGKTHKGRIDSLGLDENGCPVIVEYKRHSNENVINQGLYYLDWLLDHQAEFKWLVMEKIGKADAGNIEWSGTRMICIASDFNRYDEHAVQQINRNIELMRYRYFDDDLLLLELVNAQTVNHTIPAGTPASTAKKPPQRSSGKDKGQQDRLAEASPALLELYDTACRYIEQLGDEVQRKELKLYTAFKRIRNFVSIVIQPGKDPRLQMYLKLPGELAEDDAFSRDVTSVGHWGTGNLEINVRTMEDWDRARPLVDRAYQES